MKYTKAPSDTFEKLVTNAGVLLSDFNPASATVSSESILMATSGGVTFQAVPTYIDRADGIDNVPANTKELKAIDYYTATMSGTGKTTDAGATAFLIAAADVAGDKVTPRANLAQNDFKDVWLVADYSEYNGETKGGFVAVHLIDALSTGGYQLKTNDKGTGDLAFTFTAHYSLNAQNVVPFEIYVHEGEEEA